jgi:LAO/AO transport system kinase
LQETVATTGEGIQELVDAIFAHRAYLTNSGELARREMERSQQEVEQFLFRRLMADLVGKVPAFQRETLIAQVANRKLDPYAAVNQLFAQITNS